MSTNLLKLTASRDEANEPLSLADRLQRLQEIRTTYRDDVRQAIAGVLQEADNNGNGLTGAAVQKSRDRMLKLALDALSHTKNGKGKTTEQLQAMLVELRDRTLKHKGSADKPSMTEEYTGIAKEMATDDKGKNKLITETARRHMQTVAYASLSIPVVEQMVATAQKKAAEEAAADAEADRVVAEIMDDGKTSTATEVPAEDDDFLDMVGEEIAAAPAKPAAANSGDDGQIVFDEFESTANADQSTGDLTDEAAAMKDQLTPDEPTEKPVKKKKGWLPSFGRKKKK